MIAVHEYSRANLSYMNVGEKLTAIRFMFAIPPNEWMHIKTLPDYVFMYIYEVGALEDLPWVRWEEDETGQVIRRIRVSELSMVVGEMCKESPLLKRMEFKKKISYLVQGLIGVDKFEQMILHYAQRNSFKHTSLF